jgi:hypothetical protein
MTHSIDDRLDSAASLTGASTDPFDAEHHDNMPAYRVESDELWTWWNWNQDPNLPDYEVLRDRLNRYPTEVGFDAATGRLRLPVGFEAWKELYFYDRTSWIRYRDDMLARAPVDVIGVEAWLAHRGADPAEPPAGAQPAAGAPAPRSTAASPGAGCGERGYRIDRDELLARVDLRALLDALSGGGGERGRWHCPDRDHPDTHPSVTVSVDAAGVQRWRCWSSDHRGTAIDAVVAAQGVGVGDAMRWLADHYGAWPIVERPPAPPAAPVGAPGKAVVDYVQRAERLLWTPAGASQREWLAGRGLAEVVLRLNRVGADPGRRFLPRPKGMPGGWPAVVYPALSPGGTITYAQARYLKPPDGRDKYDNPARSHATNPRVAWLHPTDPPRPGMLVVTEGVADGLIAAQAGFATVGVLGSQYPDDRVVDAITETTQRSPRLAESTVFVCFDADPSGRAGADRLCALLGARGVPHQPVSPPDGMDLTAWAAAEPDWAIRLDPTPRPSTVTSPSLTAPAPPTTPTPGLGLGLPGPG